MTKKLFSIILSMILLVTFMPVEAQAASEIPAPEENINRLQTIKNYLVKEEKVSNINLNNNILRYVYDGKLAEIKLVENKEEIKFIVNEGEKKDIIIFEKSTIESGAQNNSNDNFHGGTLSFLPTKWVKVGKTTRYDAVLNNAIKDISASALLSYFSLLFPPLASIGITFVELIIGVYKASKSDSNKLYIYHDLYRDKNSFHRYKDVFIFYGNSDKTGHIETKTNIRIEANR